MKTVGFELANGALKAGNGAEIPIHFDKESKIVTTCWELSDEEVMELLRSKRIYLNSVVSDGKELQPIMPTIKFPPV